MDEALPRLEDNHAEVEHVMYGSKLHHADWQHCCHAGGGHPLTEPHHVRLQRRKEVEGVDMLVSHAHRGLDGPWRYLISNQHCTGGVHYLLQGIRNYITSCPVAKELLGME